MTDDTKEGTADRPSSEAAMFGRIALKNQLVGEADLRRVMSSLPRGSDLGTALEIMFTTPAVGNLIREGKTYQLASVLQTGRKQGMITMDDSIRILLRKGIVTPETARFHAEDPSAMQA